MIKIGTKVSSKEQINGKPSVSSHYKFYPDRTGVNGTEFRAPKGSSRLLKVNEGTVVDYYQEFPMVEFVDVSDNTIVIAVVEETLDIIQEPIIEPEPEISDEELEEISKKFFNEN